MAKRALFLVRDASGVAALAARLTKDFGYELWANELGGAALESAGLDFSATDAAAARSWFVGKRADADVLVANYYAVETAGRDFMSWKSALAAFDRSIVDVVRQAAWSAERVTVLGKPEEYPGLLDELGRNKGRVSQSYRTQRAVAALRAVSEFEFSVAQYLEIHGGEAPDMGALSGYPKAIRFAWPRVQSLGTGENRHQRAALYGSFDEHFEQVSGEPLDYESILNVSRAAFVIGEFERSTAALVQKGQLLHLASGNELPKLVKELLLHASEPGFWLVGNGGIGGAAVDGAVAAGAAGLLLPDLLEEEKAVLDSAKGLRAVIARSGLGYEALQEVRSVAGGALVQDRDRSAVNPMEWTVQSLAQPLVEDWEPLVMGAKVARHLASSACVCLRDGAIVAMEAGRSVQTRAWIGVEQTADRLENALVVFDEPLAAGGVLERVKRRGARLVLCPTGIENESIRAEANDLGLVLMTMPRSLRRL